MLKLFKAKSLKSNTKTEQGADNKNAKKQQGRSMVEMLGVLAIIGVLSIGGIQGYTMAMRKYRANEIINIVSKYAMVLYSGCQQAMEKDPQKYGIISEDSDEDYKNHWSCPAIQFTDAGLGSLPSGVLSMGDSRVCPPCNLSIKSFSSGDAVLVKVKFEKQELCETVMSITGKPITQNSSTDGMVSVRGEDRVCKDTGDNIYYLSIVTMMN